jgi:hypothetical protein
MPRFVHVGFAFPGAIKMRDLEPAFYAMGDDWIRYSITSWIVWTDKPAATIFVMLRPYLDAGDQVLIAPIDVKEAFGSLSPWIWNWINSKSPQPIVTHGLPVTNALANLLNPPKPSG